MTFTIPINTPANARRSDYPSGEILGVQSGANILYYTQDDFFMDGLPAALGTNLLNTSTVLSSKFLGLHIKAEDIVPSGLIVGTNRSTDQAPKWNDCNPSSGVFVDAGLGAWLTASKNAGAETIYTIYLTPTWASARPSESDPLYGVLGSRAEPASMATLAAFVTWLMTNYGDLIDYLEIRNEPKYNTTASSFYSGTPSTLAQEARIVNITAKAIKPTVKIIGIAVADCTGTDTLPAGSSNSGVQITNLFLSASDGNGGLGKDWIDILSFHSYATSPNLSAFDGSKTLINNMKTANSVSAMPVWGTEFSYISPDFINYTGAGASRMRALIRLVLMNLVIGFERAIPYAYAQLTLGWQKDPAANAEWNKWAAILNGATVTRINRIGANGQLACVINGQNYLI